MKKVIYTLIFVLTISSCTKQKCQTCTATYYDYIGAKPRVELYENCSGYDLDGVLDADMNPWKQVTYSNCSDFKNK